MANWAGGHVEEPLSLRHHRTFIVERYQAAAVSD